jgi:hypothetical protein
MITPALIQKALASSDLTQFRITEQEIAGDTCVLVVPSEMGVDWNKDNLVLRSLIYRKADYHPISLSFTKFFNYGEKPGCYSNPNSYPISDWTIDNKEDGSTLIISRYKGVPIVRTRGSFGTSGLDNSSELDNQLAREVHLALNCTLVADETTTLLFEWLSPANRIVLPIERPELVLIGAISHLDYKYYSPAELDSLAASLGFRRPERFTFGSISDILATCKALKGREGFVLSYNGNQERVKLKTDFYLRLHRLKSSLNSYWNLLDIWFEEPNPSLDSVSQRIEREMDYELAVMVRPVLEEIAKDYCAAKGLEDKIRNYLETNGPLLPSVSKKDRAMRINSTFGPFGLTGYAFAIANGKTVETRKLVEAIRKHEVGMPPEMLLGFPSI